MSTLKTTVVGLNLRRLKKEKAEVLNNVSVLLAASSYTSQMGGLQNRDWQSEVSPIVSKDQVHDNLRPEEPECT